MRRTGEDGVSLVLLLATQLLHVDSLSHLVAADDGLLGVGLTGTELAHDAGLLKLPLELLEGARCSRPP